MLNYTEREIANLQDNLELIRHAGGWSTAAFGNLLGVSKQTVINLESKKTTMNKMQYIAIRTILDYEIETTPDNKVLAYTVHHLLDSDHVTAEDRKKVEKAVAFTSGAKTTGLDSFSISAGLMAIIGVAALDLLSDPATIKAASKWLKKLMK